MNSLEMDNIRQQVREDYGSVAKNETSGCNSASCCGSPAGTLVSLSLSLGYSKEEIGVVPEGANMGLGCGNPQAIAALKDGEWVLDLGSGGGFDCFLAARQVGETGRVIGVDMTPEMISKARANAVQGSYTNTEFRLGEIEHLPIADNTVDVVISNCVINLSPDKAQVFAETYRALKPGGRLAISDIVATAELPAAIRQDRKLYTGCMAGASHIDEIRTMLAKVGFQDIRITPKDASKAFIRDWAPGTDITDYVVSANIEAVKPSP